MKVLAYTALILSSVLALDVQAQLAVSANDNKAVLENGATRVVANAAPDTVAIIDLSAKPPRLLAEIEAPTSVVGPPFSVAVAPDESYALVTAAMKVEAGQQVPDNKISVIDLKSTPPRVIATAQAGAGVSGISINRQGTLALAANRNEGTVSVFGIAGKTLTPLAKLKLGDEKSGPSHVAITPDGTMALVTRDGDSRISVLAINGTTVEYTKRDLYAGQRPYGLDICSAGMAVVANIGVGQGDADTVSLIDLAAKPPRVIDTVSVGQTPEGIICAPDGKTVAVTVMNGSNKPTGSPFYNQSGKLVLLRIDGQKLTKFAEAPVGNWGQGIAFSADGRTLLMQNMVQKELQVLSLEGNELRDTGQRIKLKGGPAAIRTATR